MLNVFTMKLILTVKNELKIGMDLSRQSRRRALGHGEEHRN